MLWSMGSERVRHDLATEQQQTIFTVPKDDTSYGPRGSPFFDGPLKDDFALNLLKPSKYVYDHITINSVWMWKLVSYWL